MLPCRPSRPSLASVLMATRFFSGSSSSSHGRPATRPARPPALSFQRFPEIRILPGTRMHSRRFASSRSESTESSPSTPGFARAPRVSPYSHLIRASDLSAITIDISLGLDVNLTSTGFCFVASDGAPLSFACRLLTVWAGKHLRSGTIDLSKESYLYDKGKILTDGILSLCKEHLVLAARSQAGAGVAHTAWLQVALPKDKPKLIVGIEDFVRAFGGGASLPHPRCSSD